MDVLKHYVDLFNKEDEELYINDIDNSHVYEWLKSEIPLFECSDKDIERTYYFRYWTYRKHIKTTEDGYIITEFLPKVSWSKKHNAINCAIGHHISEGRWLKNADKYLLDYINFFLSAPKEYCVYSAWMLYAFWELYKVVPSIEINSRLLDKMCRYYEFWEDTHRLKNGLFWSIDGYDAMEFSISGTPDKKHRLKGVRPTLNSYMCADAFAISEFAKIVGDLEISQKYLQKHEFLKKEINEKLWKDGFYRAFHYETIEELDALDTSNTSLVREEIGYIPWMFGIAPKEYNGVFDLLLDENVFACEYGITTADKSHPDFLYESTHECLWNGYVWPFATSQTLSALIYTIKNNSDTKKFKNMFAKLLRQYAKSHTRTREDGTVVPWIDEVRHPMRDEWSAREILKSWGWHENMGGKERGKDYNHSTFCDLVISGLVGVSCENGVLTASPCIDDSIEYFKLSNLHFNGKIYTVTYDKTGEKYGLGKGVFVDCK